MLYAYKSFFGKVLEFAYFSYTIGRKLDEARKKHISKLYTYTGVSPLFTILQEAVKTVSLIRKDRYMYPTYII